MYIRKQNLKIKLITMLFITIVLCLLEFNVKAFTLTLTAQPDKNAIKLDWNSPKGQVYKIWQLKPGDTEYQSI